MQAFNYAKPASVAEAARAAGAADAKLLAGGQSLLAAMKLGLAAPAALVDLGGLTELKGITVSGGAVKIGAMTTHAAVAASKEVAQAIPALAAMAAGIGDRQVRNRGTIGGSLAHSDPAADYPAAVLALEGELRLESATGARTVKAEDFFIDLMTTAIKPGEILTAVRFAPLAAGAGFAYFKHRQPASGFAIVGVAACLTLDKSGKCQGAHIGITGLGAKAFRAKAVENALNGKAADAKVLAYAAAHAADGIDPLSDIHASADFRAELARVYTRRALESAVARAKG